MGGANCLSSCEYCSFYGFPIKSNGYYLISLDILDVTRPRYSGKAGEATSLPAPDE